MTDAYCGIEAGGTKFVCAIGKGPSDILAEERFPTTTPKETIARTINFFIRKGSELGVNLVSLGIGSFGPIDIDPESSSYGYITTTPKPGWENAAIVEPISNALNIPIVFDTDVNAAAIGEGRWGAAKNIHNFIYLTIGTGVGGGAIINNLPLHGLIHPEMGHILLNQSPNDKYLGHCPYHKNCFEGLACGPAISDRWNSPTHLLLPDHPAWDLEADYIAQALSTLICSFSPEKIILGGGVMSQEHLFPRIHLRTREYLNNYVQSDMIRNHIDEYIVPPGLGNKAGMLGAIAMAHDLMQ